MSNVLAIKPIAQISPRMQSQHLGVFFANPDLDMVENQVNVYHAPTLVNIFTYVQLEFETFCAMLAATSIQ